MIGALAVAAAAIATWETASGAQTAASDASRRAVITPGLSRRRLEEERSSRHRLRSRPGTDAPSQSRATPSAPASEPRVTSTSRAGQSKSREDRDGEQERKDGGADPCRGSAASDARQDDCQPQRPPPGRPALFVDDVDRCTGARPARGREPPVAPPLQKRLRLGGLTPNRDLGRRLTAPARHRLEPLGPIVAPGHGVARRGLPGQAARGLARRAPRHGAGPRAGR